MIYPVSQPILCSVYATAVNDKTPQMGAACILSVMHKLTFPALFIVG